MNAVMNRRVRFSGRTLLREVSEFFTCAGNIVLVSVYLPSVRCVSAISQVHICCRSGAYLLSVRCVSAVSQVRICCRSGAYLLSVSCASAVSQD